MTVLSALTTDELLDRLPNGWQWRIPLCDELRRRLSAGERAEKDVTRMALAIRELSEKHEQAEARVVELERERNEALARVDGGLWEDWLRASELRDVAERESDRLRAALEEIANRNWVMHSRDDSEAFDAVVAFARRALSASRPPAPRSCESERDRLRAALEEIARWDERQAYTLGFEGPQRIARRALSAGSETSDKPWPIGDQPSCPIAGPCDGECGLCEQSAATEGSDRG